jgi:hypothetical protein
MVSFVRSVPDPLLSNSEQQSRLNSIHLGHSLGLSMFATLSMAYRVQLIVPMNHPNWFLVLPPKNGLNTFWVSNQGF